MGTPTGMNIIDVCRVKDDHVNSIWGQFRCRLNGSR